MSKTILVHLSLGSNLGNRIFFLNHACKELEMMSLQNFNFSNIFESKPLLNMKQPNYYNIVVRGLTELTPIELLKKCQQIEDKLGRERLEKWGARNIDLDILSYGNKIIDTEELNIPHPEIEKRSFVLMPLLELSPTWIHPIKGISIGSIWETWKRSNKESLPKIIEQKINLDDHMLAK